MCNVASSMLTVLRFGIITTIILITWVFSSGYHRPFHHWPIISSGLLDGLCAGSTPITFPSQRGAEEKETLVSSPITLRRDIARPSPSPSSPILFTRFISILHVATAHHQMRSRDKGTPLWFAYAIVGVWDGFPSIHFVHPVLYLIP